MSAGELSDLGNHLIACDQGRGRLFEFRRARDAVNLMAECRVITVLALLSVVSIVVVSW
jgi:hypothetical protein